MDIETTDTKTFETTDTKTLRTKYHIDTSIVVLIIMLIVGVLFFLKTTYERRLKKNRTSQHEEENKSEENAETEHKRHSQATETDSQNDEKEEESAEDNPRSPNTDSLGIDTTDELEEDEQGYTILNSKKKTKNPYSKPAEGPDHVEGKSSIGIKIVKSKGTAHIECNKFQPHLSKRIKTEAAKTAADTKTSSKKKPTSVIALQLHAYSMTIFEWYVGFRVSSTEKITFDEPFNKPATKQINEQIAATPNPYRSAINAAAYHFHKELGRCNEEEQRAICAQAINNAYRKFVNENQRKSPANENASPPQSTI